MHAIDGTMICERHRAREGERQSGESKLAHIAHCGYRKRRARYAMKCIERVSLKVLSRDTRVKWLRVRMRACAMLQRKSPDERDNFIYSLVTTHRRMTLFEIK